MGMELEEDFLREARDIRRQQESSQENQRPAADKTNASGIEIGDCNKRTAPVDYPDYEPGI